MKGQSFIDHLVITAPDLESGSDYVFQQLGVKPQPGGKHERMGTHNRLLKLGDSIYLEVIAVNPQSLPVGRARWFELDNINTDTKLKFATWVVRTNDIHAAAKASPIPLGAVELMSRGDLNWLITIPEDGVMPMNGIIPVLIQWETTIHPADKLANSHCSFIQLNITHPDIKMIEYFLEAINFNGQIKIEEGEQVSVSAQIKSPNGEINFR